MKKLSLWLVVLSMLTTLLPGTMVSAADANSKEMKSVKLAEDKAIAAGEHTMHSAITNIECLADVKNVGSGTNTIYFTPTIYSKGTIGATRNFWNNLDDIYENYRQWVAPASFGENLRMTVDNIGN